MSQPTFKVHLRMAQEDIDKLIAAVDRGELKHLGVITVERVPNDTPLFVEWMDDVDRWLFANCGTFSPNYPGFPFYDLFTQGKYPEDAARAAVIAQEVGESDFGKTSNYHPDEAE